MTDEHIPWPIHRADVASKQAGPRGKVIVRRRDDLFALRPAWEFEVRKGERFSIREARKGER